MSRTPAGDITALLLAASKGDVTARARFMEIVLPELRARAEFGLRDARTGHTLQPTALVNEAYLKLMGDKGRDWEGRGHFLACAAIAMKHILIDHARGKGRVKRGGDPVLVQLDAAVAAAEGKGIDLLALDEALAELARLDARQASIVEMRFFAGMTHEEVGRQLGISTRLVEKEWNMARGWLKRRVLGLE